MSRTNRERWFSALLAALLIVTGLTACTPARTTRATDSAKVTSNGFSLQTKDASAEAGSGVAGPKVGVTLAEVKHVFPAGSQSFLNSITTPVRLRLDGDRQPKAKITLRIKVDQSKVSKASWSKTSTYAILTQSAHASSASLLPATYDAKTGELVAVIDHLSWFLGIQLDVGGFLSKVGKTVSGVLGVSYENPGCAPDQYSVADSSGTYQVEPAWAVVPCLTSDNTGLQVHAYSVTGIPFSVSTTPRSRLIRKASLGLSAQDNFVRSMFKVTAGLSDEELLAPGDDLTFSFPAGSVPQKLTFAESPAALLLVLLFTAMTADTQGGMASARTVEKISDAACFADLIQKVTDAPSTLTSAQASQFTVAVIGCATSILGGTFLSLLVAAPSFLTNFFFGLVQEFTGQGNFTMPIRRTAAPPVLAQVWANNQQGFGKVAPTVVANGGDGTGVLTRINWKNWGAATATGAGFGCHTSPGGFSYQCEMTPAIAVATHLGTCDGKRAYEDFGWYYPSLGESSPNWVLRNCERGGDDTATASNSEVVLGDPETAYYPGTESVGFGLAKPTILNQDSTSSRGITDLSWTSWGDASAYGRGKRCFAGSCSAVTVRVSNLGTCGGQAAYMDAAVKVKESSRYDETIIRDCNWPG